MRRHPTFALILVALTAALAGCGGSGGGSAETTTEAATTTTAPTTTAEATTIRINVVDGKPDGGIVRPTVNKGDHVVLVVNSDTADEVHVHGYDLMTDVAAGGTARIEFDADTAGRFDVELENLGVQLAEITVS